MLKFINMCFNVTQFIKNLVAIVDGALVEGVHLFGLRVEHSKLLVLGVYEQAFFHYIFKL